MQVVIQINGRDALPVRALPFVGRWQWMASPDGLAFACSQSPTKIKLLLATSDKGESEVAVRNREFLPSFALGEDGAVRAMHPEEWYFCAVELQGLEKRLRNVERSEDENLDIWLRQAIEKLPAEAFVWLDDFRRWFADTYQPDCNEQDKDDSIAAEPTLQPLVPPELENMLSCGGWFRRSRDRAAAVSPYGSLTSALEGWFDTPYDELPGEQWHRVKTDFWPMPWDELSPSQRRSVAAKWDYSHDPDTEDYRNQMWELFCQCDDVQREIRELEIIKPQSITEKIAQSDRLRALRDQERLLQAQLSGNAVVSLQEEQAQAPSEAEAAIAESAAPQSAEREPTNFSLPEFSADGVIKKKILEVDWRLPSKAPQMKNILDEIPKWVSSACKKVGRVGKGPAGSHIWNPAQLAVCLAIKTPGKQWVVGKGALTGVIKDNFPDYLDEWERMKDQLNTGY